MCVSQGLFEWKNEIKKVTSLDREVKSGSEMDEVNFWIRKEKAIIHIYDQLESPAVGE